MKGNRIKKGARRQPTVVAVSGGFDPIHVGHVRMFAEAKKLGDRLVVILNNDNWLRKKKQHIFMPEHERKEVIASLAAVDEVVLTDHGPDAEDMSVSSMLYRIRPHIFANGGDRKKKVHPPLEVTACKAIGAQMVFNVGSGGKVQSSSWLLAKYVDSVAKNKQVLPARKSLRKRPSASRAR